MTELGVVRRNIERADRAAVDTLAQFGVRPCTRRWGASA